MDVAERATPLPDLLEPLDLDALTVRDDDRFVDALAKDYATEFARLGKQLKLSGEVTLDLFKNETGSLAHYVLPATSPLERADPGPFRPVGT